jgi:hypothetical protein
MHAAERNRVPCCLPSNPMPVTPNVILAPPSSEIAQEADWLDPSSEEPSSFRSEPLQRSDLAVVDEAQAQSRTAVLHMLVHARWQAERRHCTFTQEHRCVAVGRVEELQGSQTRRGITAGA